MLNIESLRFRAISHLSEGEVVEYLSSLAGANLPRGLPLDNATDRETEYTRNSTENREPTRAQQEPMRDSYIDEFASGRNNDVGRLKEECNKLRFEKLALENTVAKLKEEMQRKDEVIRNLTAQGQANVQNLVMKPNIVPIGNIRHTMTPQY